MLIWSKHVNGDLIEVTRLFFNMPPLSFIYSFTIILLCFHIRYHIDTALTDIERLTDERIANDRNNNRRIALAELKEAEANHSLEQLGVHPSTLTTIILTALLDQSCRSVSCVIDCVMNVIKYHPNWHVRVDCELNHNYSWRLIPMISQPLVMNGSNIIQANDHRLSTSLVMMLCDVLYDDSEVLRKQMQLLQRQLTVEVDGHATSIAQLRALEGTIEAHNDASRQHHINIQNAEHQSNLLLNRKLAVTKRSNSIKKC
jgi:hypothetical protein